MSLVKKIASYLPKLSESEYVGIPRGLSSLVNYAVDTYFYKMDQLNSKREVGPIPPMDPTSDIKEKWLGCEIHKCLVVNQTYPAFGKALNAHAFAMLMYPYGGEMAPYQIVPYLDGYQWKHLIKGNYEWKLQQVSLKLSLNESRVLPVYGTFFVIDRSSQKKLIISIDLCYENLGCKFSITTAPSDKGLSQKFLTDLEASRTANDIYFKKCLTYNSGQLDFCEVSNNSWSQIILKPQIKDTIKANSIGILNNIEKLSGIGLTPSRNTLLISPPGMAKTTMFRAITHESTGKFTTIWCTGKSINNADDVTSLFEAARSLAPCMIMIEDMDLFGRDRSSGQPYDNHVLNEFLACLDGSKENFGVVVLASTNDVASMDEACVRPGRFDLKIEIPLPDPNDRLKMVEIFCSQYKADCSHPSMKDAIKNVINLTDGLTGAYIKDLIKSAVIQAVNNGQMSDGVVHLTADNLLSAANMTMKNFEIGKRTKKHHKYEIDVNHD